MPIIQSRAPKKERLKVEINSEIYNKINEYCKWAKIDDFGFFIEEAAGYIFGKDREWKQYKKSLKNKIESA